MACARLLLWAAPCLLLLSCSLDWHQSNASSDADVDEDSGADSRSNTQPDGGLDASTSSILPPSTPDDGGTHEDTGSQTTITVISQPTAICGGTACLRGGCSSDGSYCLCPVTWTGSTCEEDVDECKLGGNGCTAPYACFNTKGGFTCAGQQADFPIPPAVRNPDDYVIGPNNSTLLDKATGLMWELSVDETDHNNWGAARDHCKLDLSNGLYADWRLPSLIEYATLFAQDPFPSYPAAMMKGLSGLWWTSSDVAGSLGQTWLVRLETGKTEIATSILFSFAYVRCVRTAESKFEGLPAQRYRLDAVADLVSDTRTLLTFQKRASANVSSVAAAEAQCRALSQGGRSFRLPTLLELLSTLDPALAAPTMARAFDGPFVPTWSSGSAKDEPGAHLCVDTNSGAIVATQDGPAGCAVRCVSAGVH